MPAQSAAHFDPAGPDDATSATAKTPFRLRTLSLVVLAMFVMVSVGLYVVVRQETDNQEHRLLVERTAEIGSLLSSAVSGGIQSSLTAMATAAQQPTTTAFSRTAQSTVAAGSTIAAIALVRRDGSQWVVDAAAGTDLKAGEVVSRARVAPIEASGAKLHSDIVVVRPGTSRLVVTLGPPAAPAGAVVYEEFIVDPSSPAPVTKSAPFHELNVALYVGNQPRADKLLVSTAPHTPLSGHTATSTLAVGDGSWLVVSSARHPLAGSVANALPAILGAVALLIGAAMTVVVETVGRRRDYALALVAERTEALQQSMRELQTAQQALVTNERMAALGQMAATVGHELRNPLGVLTNSMYLIRGAVSSTADERLRRQLDTADREISAATLIVSDLLEFSRPRMAQPVSVDLAELVGEVISVAPPPTGVRVVQQTDDVPPIVVDRYQIRQVLLNLLRNAYEAMPEGGTVTIAARTVDDTGSGTAADQPHLEISVTDTGVGMDDATREQAFEPFFSLKVKGTGLGLAVSRRIVEEHGGSLEITSEEGQGASMRLWLPLAPVEAVSLA